MSWICQLNARIFSSEQFFICNDCIKRKNKIKTKMYLIKMREYTYTTLTSAELTNLTDHLKERKDEKTRRASKNPHMAKRIRSTHARKSFQNALSYRNALRFLVIAEKSATDERKGWRKTIEEERAVYRRWHPGAVVYHSFNSLAHIFSPSSLSVSLSLSLSVLHPFFLCLSFSFHFCVWFRFHSRVFI